MAWIAADITRPPRPRGSAKPWRERAGWIAALAVAVLRSALGLGSGGRGTPVASDAQEMRLQIVTPPGASSWGFAVSPDRRALVYQATTKAAASSGFVRSTRTRRGRWTGRRRPAWAPFWKPDGRSIGFFTSDQLKRIDLDGGLVRTLASAPQPRGGTWGTKGTILFAAGSAGSLNAVPDGGGDAVVVTRVERPRQTGHRFPHFLPDGRHFLFTPLAPQRAAACTWARSVRPTRSVSSMRTRPRSSLRPIGCCSGGKERSGRSAWISPRCDRSASRCRSRHSWRCGGPLWRRGTLGDGARMIAYRAGAGTRQFRWFDRTGRPVGAMGDPDEGQPASPQLSPDGRTVMFRRTLSGNTDLWSIEARRNVLRKLTSDPARDYEAVWSPGGDRMVFSSDRKGVLNLYETSLSGGSASAETLLLETSEHKSRSDWSADGRFILYTVQSPTTGNDLWVLPLFGDRRPTPMAQTAASELRGRFSPDGRWVAYESNESGRSEIYVQSFPDLARKTRISTGGGTTPVWRGDGHELFFRSPDDQLMAARIAPSGTRSTRHAIRLVRPPTGPNRDRAHQAWYAASRDGQRFLVNTIVEGASPITVLLNWKPKSF